MNRWAVLLLLIPVLAFAAETGYRVVHPDGTVEFTDQQPPAGEAIQLDEVQTFSAPPPPRTPPTGAAPHPKASEPQRLDYTVSILRPQPEETFWTADFTIPVTVSVAPSLATGHRVVVLVDGQQALVAEAAGSYTVQPVYRGAHQVSAQVLDANGVPLATSEANTFYVHKHTVPRP